MDYTDADFEDPTPIGADGWPDPPKIEHDEPSSDEMKNIDSVFGVSFTPPKIKKPDMPTINVDADTAAGLAVSTMSAVVVVALDAGWVVGVVTFAVSAWMWLTTGRNHGIAVAMGAIAAASMLRLSPMLLVLALILVWTGAVYLHGETDS